VAAAAAVKEGVAVVLEAEVAQIRSKVRPFKGWRGGLVLPTGPAYRKIFNDYG
jgi:hypothetical protein